MNIYNLDNHPIWRDRPNSSGGEYADMNGLCTRDFYIEKSFSENLAYQHIPFRSKHEAFNICNRR